MKTARLILPLCLLISLALIPLPGCLGGRSQPPLPVPPAAKLGAITGATMDAREASEKAQAADSAAHRKVAANLETAAIANEGNPAGAPKATVADAIEMAKANNGRAEPDPAELALGEKLARANAEGRAAEAAKLRDAAIAKADASAAEAIALREKVQGLLAKIDANTKAAEARLEAERGEAKRERDAAVAQARMDAEKEQRRIISWIFFGLGGLFIAAGVGVFFLASYVPQLGPRVALAVIGAGFALVAVGIGILQAMNNPWIMWTGLVLVAVLLAGAVALVYANNHHEKTKA